MASSSASRARASACCVRSRSVCTSAASRSMRSSAQRGLLAAGTSRFELCRGPRNIRGAHPGCAAARASRAPSAADRLRHADRAAAARWTARPIRRSRRHRAARGCGFRAPARRRGHRGRGRPAASRGPPRCHPAVTSDSPCGELTRASARASCRVSRGADAGQAPQHGLRRRARAPPAIRRLPALPGRRLRPASRWPAGQIARSARGSIERFHMHGLERIAEHGLHAPLPALVRLRSAR